MKSANPVFASLGTTVFEVMSQLARRHDAVNLGQGFPDGRGPEDVLTRAAEAVLTGWNQYPPMMGLPELRQAVADHDRRFYGVEVDWESEVMVTSGATEAIAGALLGLVEPGDEVVLFEPFYDAYLPLVRRAGAEPRFVKLRPPYWRIEREDLARAFSPRTKAVMFNNPLNPAARVFSEEEIDLLAEFVEGVDAYVISDEVYEHIVFDGRRHKSLLEVPALRNRTVKIGSAGKTFSLTGWKVGYVTAAPALLQPLAKAHQFLTFTTPPNLQAAIAFGLAKEDAYFDGLADDMQARRDLFSTGLTKLGFTVLPCEGAYFVNIDIGGMGWNAGDTAYCRHLVETFGVAAIPVSAFYAADPVTSVVRFCFAKKNAVLDLALERLSRASGGTA